MVTKKREGGKPSSSSYSYTTGLFPSLWTFFESYNSFIWLYLLWNCLNFGMLLNNVLSITVFILCFKVLTISCQKIQICERTLIIFWQFIRGPSEFASFCVGFSSGKIHVLKNHEKPKIWGFWKKWPFGLVFLYW